MREQKLDPVAPPARGSPPGRESIFLAVGGSAFLDDKSDRGGWREDERSVNS